MPNIAKLEAVLDQIRMHPETHNQVYWGKKKTGCHTAYCFAGWTCVLEGYTDFDWELWRHTPVELAECVKVDGAYRTIGAFAAEILGLSSNYANVLFSGTNTFDELELMVKNISNGDHITHNIERFAKLNAELEAIWEQTNG